MLNNLLHKKIILASQSPRRHLLLKEIVDEFEIATPRNIEENYPEGLSKNEIPVFLSELKAKAYNDLIEEQVVLITSDTIVWKDQRVLGKPKDLNHAKEMLKELSDSNHEVVTGVTLTSINKQVSFHSNTMVYFDVITNEEIDFYLNKFKPLDKAGAYGIQEWIGYIGVKSIEGSYFNVMGFPLHAVYTALKEF